MSLGDKLAFTESLNNVEAHLRLGRALGNVFSPNHRWRAIRMGIEEKFCVAIETILAEIDEEIARLQQVKRLLGRTPSKPVKTSPSNILTVGKRRAKRKLSPEARERIAAAQRKRWAAAKKAAK